METNKIVDAFLNKFINEEIMTKSELSVQLDNVMQKYVNHIDNRMDHIEHKMSDFKNDVDSRFESVNKRFESVDKRFESIGKQYNWIIGLIITASISIISLVVKLH